MSCGEGPTSDFPINNRKLVDYILIKFLSPAISNYANNISAMEKPKNQKHQKQSKKENLYYGNLRIFFWKLTYVVHFAVCLIFFRPLS